MSQDNVDVVEAWLASFTADADAFRETLHPEIEWFPFEDNHSPSHGIDAAMRIRSEWLASWNAMRAELEDVHDEGDSVIASVHVSGQGKTSGADVDVRLHMHFRMLDGKIVYLFEHTDKAEALAAAGLSE